MPHTPIDVLVIGAGMHVSGRGTSGYGTVLPAVVQAHRDGLVGRLLVAATNANSIQVEYSQRRVIPEKVFRSWVEQANSFQYLAVHYVDILLFALGAIPRRAMAIGQYGYLKERSINTYDSVQALIEWGVPGSEVPFVSTFLTNWVDPNKTSALSYQSIKVFGTTGRFESDQRDRGLQLVTEADGIEDINPYFAQTYPSPRGSSREYRGYGIDSIRAFLDDSKSLLDGERTPADLESLRPTFRQALRSTAVVEAVNQSLQSKSEWVPVRPSE